jgi:hypothetical protein
MGTSIGARLSHGVLEPLEQLDGPDGAVGTVTRIRLPAPTMGSGRERAAGGWTGLMAAGELPRHTSAGRLLATRPAPRS